MTHSLRALFALTVALVTVAAAAEDAPPRQLWLYYSTNLLVEKNVDQLRAVWGRAAKAGYSHVQLNDSKFSRLADMDQRYFANVERTKRIAAELKLTLVPGLFSVGYSNDLLSRDPNLAEGLPVKDAPFVVKDGVATLQADPAVAFRPKFSFVDENVVLDAAQRTATVSNHTANARLNQQLRLTPYRHYHVSVQVKTEDYTGKPEVKAIAADGVQLNWTNLGVQRTQDWTTHHVTFNSLGHAEVAVYFGVWGQGTGTLRWRDWKIEEVGLLNVLRRPGAPLVVKQGERTLAEGKDFEPVRDPKLGNVPFAGEYSVFHDAPALKTKGLADGTQLRVSWYHPHVVYDGQVCCCLGEPKLKEVLAAQAKGVRALFDAPGYMMHHDEIRVLNQDAACATGQTPGQMLADNARFCAKLLDGATVYAWNDMFDPFHNAVKGPYYLVNGPFTDSWEGLDKSVIIMNWNFGKREQSLKFFADRGHRQVLAGYYDDKPERVKDWLAAAAKVPNVVGVMYTTWRNDYSNLEAFAKLAR